MTRWEMIDTDERNNGDVIHLLEANGQLVKKSDYETCWKIMLSRIKKGDTYQEIGETTRTGIMSYEQVMMEKEMHDAWTSGDMRRYNYLLNIITGKYQNG